MFSEIKHVFYSCDFNFNCRLKVFYNSSTGEKKIKVRFPIFMLMGRKPLNNVWLQENNFEAINWL